MTCTRCTHLHTWPKAHLHTWPKAHLHTWPKAHLHTRPKAHLHTWPKGNETRNERQTNNSRSVPVKNSNKQTKLAEGRAVSEEIGYWHTPRSQEVGQGTLLHLKLYTVRRSFVLDNSFRCNIKRVSDNRHLTRRWDCRNVYKSSWHISKMPGV